MRKYALIGMASVMAAGTIALGTGTSSAMPMAFCVYTTNQQTSVFQSASDTSTTLYIVPSGTTVSAVNTPISGPGGPFYKGEATGRAQGYIKVSHLTNQRSCAT